MGMTASWLESAYNFQKPKTIVRRSRNRRDYPPSTVSTAKAGTTVLRADTVLYRRTLGATTFRAPGATRRKVQIEGAKPLHNGGGPGKYAIALAKQGHSVTLSDLLEESLDVARRDAENGNIHPDAVIHTNALDVPLHLACVDLHATFHLVLCLGPLYNLIAPHNRSTVIRNCIKMVKPGGSVYAPSLRTFVTWQDVLRFVFRQNKAAMNDISITEIEQKFKHGVLSSASCGPCAIAIAVSERNRR
ncbi:hypothetical protein BKA63DRAFT_497639 [Paraphoma chrysanthemicola]|nr:hypothetical protein BKA63DRAFT_497639 [Paraphoma chrysanthemicola]